MDKHIRSRIEKSVERLEKSPKLGKQLKGFPSTTRSYRFGTPGGEYRIIYELMEEDEVVFVFLIGPRGDVYEDLTRRMN
ncbi:type II toxin-antitoxin system RelE/ParE family toxin [Candidatus Bipolaricaulota bacterium]|nr:type II toxin-antitoxin system RelE/ParE family toxin [Candidatus Bipolaricaulota bacterium]